MEQKRRCVLKRGLIFACIALILDQLSKWGIAHLFENGFQGWSFGGFFNIVKAWNTGVSFSMFSEGGLAKTLVLVLFALVVVGWLLYWKKHEENALAQVSLGLIIGGALGNVIDRIRFGAVLDFLDFYYQKWHWPAFNLADSFICVGVFMLIFQNVWSFEKKKGDKK